MHQPPPFEAFGILQLVFCAQQADLELRKLNIAYELCARNAWWSGSIVHAPRRLLNLRTCPPWSPCAAVRTPGAELSGCREHPPSSVRGAARIVRLRPFRLTDGILTDSLTSVDFVVGSGSELGPVADVKKGCRRGEADLDQMLSADLKACSPSSSSGSKPSRNGATHGARSGLRPVWILIEPV